MQHSHDPDQKAKISAMQRLTTQGIESGMSERTGAEIRSAARREADIDAARRILKRDGGQAPAPDDLKPT